MNLYEFVWEDEEYAVIKNPFLEANIYEKSMLFNWTDGLKKGDKLIFERTKKGFEFTPHEEVLTNG